jgi:hypothetical protein
VDAAQKKIMIQKTPSLPKILKKKPKKEKATKAADMSASTLLKRNKGLFKNHPKTSPAHKINRKPIKMPEPTPKIRKFIDFFEKKDVANSMVTLMQKEPSKKTLKHFKHHPQYSQPELQKQTARCQGSFPIYRN